MKNYLEAFHIIIISTLDPGELSIVTMALFFSWRMQNLFVFDLSILLGIGF